MGNARYAGWAVEQGIVKIEGTEFDPDKTITREEFAVMVAAFINDAEKNLGVHSYTKMPERKIEMDRDLPAVNSPADYKDTADISDWAMEAVAQLQAVGIMIGSDGEFNPTDILTRAELAVAMQGVMKYIGCVG